jgi:myo-inositol-1(or 4)-monophosphatase
VTTGGVRAAPTALEELAIEVAHAAGVLLRRYADERRAGADLDVAAKSSATDPVSDADRAGERLIVDRLRSARPDDGLLGEEQTDRRGTSGLRWLVDPLDGTVNFLYGRPTWSVSIACVDEDGPLVGVVHQPALDETFHAVRGGGAHLDGRPLAVTEVGDLDQALVATGFAYDPAVRADQGRDLADLLPRIRDVRRDGSAALDLAWCAAGRVDAYLEFGLDPWDWAAGSLLVREAGGRVSEHRRTLGGRARSVLVAGGGSAHDALASWLADRP